MRPKSCNWIVYGECLRLLKEKKKEQTKLKRIKSVVRRVKLSVKFLVLYHNYKKNKSSNVIQFDLSGENAYYFEFRE